MVDKDFWRNKRILVTGCTGFKGSWLTTWLLQMDAVVLGYALAPNTIPSMFNLLNLADKINYCEGDIRDFEKFKQFINQSNPEIIIHMAAQPLVRYSYQSPIETYQTNVMGVLNLFELARQNNHIRAIVNVTTDKCYENKEWLWGYRENEPLGGYDPYSNSKACSELVTSCYQQSYFNIRDYKLKHHILLASARAGNVIGGGDWAEDRLIPDMIKAFSKSETVKIRNPFAIRPWQHVLEPLAGYLLLAQKLYLGEVNYSSAWNFGPEDKDVKNVEEIVKDLSSLWGNGATWGLEHAANLLHEANYLKLDCSKAKALLQWSPVWSLNDTLVKIVEWYKAHQANSDLYQLTIEQIKEYQGKNYE